MNCVKLFSVSNSKKYILFIHDFLWNISLTLSTLLNSYFSYEFVGVLFRRLKTFLWSKVLSNNIKKATFDRRKYSNNFEIYNFSANKNVFQKERKNNKIKKKFVKNLSVASISYSWNVLYCVFSFLQLFLSNN